MAARLGLRLTLGQRCRALGKGGLESVMAKQFVDNLFSPLGRVLALILFLSLTALALHQGWATVAALAPGCAWRQDFGRT
jgi:hypothetical protein